MKRSICKLLTAIILGTFVLPVFAMTSTPSSDKRAALTEDQKIIHVLNRLGFGARPGDIEKVRTVGIERYIKSQLDPNGINDGALDAKIDGLDIYKMKTPELFAKYPNPGVLLRTVEGPNRNRQQQQEPQNEENTADARKERRQKLRELYDEYDLKPAAGLMPQIVSNRVLRAVYSEKQLQEVMVDFWQNHFNVYSGKGVVRWYIPSYERDVLRKHALGNFKDLLVGTAQHPAMLFFLDNFQSVSPTANQRQANNNRRQRQMNPRQRARMEERMRERGMSSEQMQTAEQRQQRQQRQQRGINENYARELLELHTLGVEGGYTQQDIVEIAKAFTGWTIADPRGGRMVAEATNMTAANGRQMQRGRRGQGMPQGVESGEFYFNERWHEKGDKKVLGQSVNEGGINDGLKVIDIVANHPSTAKFIAKKLAVKFVSDNPSDAFVSRIAAAFTRSKGDIKTTLSAIFTDKEFFAPENYRAKIKTPFELAVSTVRTIGANTTPSPAFLSMLNKLGEVPYGYQAPTGYPDTAEDWVNTGALLERLNFAVAVAGNRIPGTNVDLKKFGSGGSDSLDEAIKLILDNDVSPQTVQMLKKQMESPLPDVAADEETDIERGRARLKKPTGNPEVFKAVSLVLGTPEFQRQ